MAGSVLKALQSSQIHALIAADDELWAGPALESVTHSAVGAATRFAVAQQILN